VKIAEEELESTMLRYASVLKETMDDLLANNIDGVGKMVAEIYKRIDGYNEVHIVGNGGSAANAHHIVGDFTKTFTGYNTKLRMATMADNGCYLTAAANDLDYSEVYTYLIPHRISKGDLCIFLSGSGNSANLVKCARKAKDYGILTASISAYGGGELGRLCDITIKLSCDDMEVAEDMQIITFHIIKQQLCEYLESAGVEKIELLKYNKRVNQKEIA